MENRRKKIVELVNQEGNVTLQRLREAFPEVSDVTLRKDLSYLDSTTQLVRTHGGAKALPSGMGILDSFFNRININPESKARIAQKAVSLLQPNLSVYIAPGSTCNAMVKKFPGINLHAFTDGLVTAMELSRHPNIQTTVLGGELDTNDMRLRGANVFSLVENLRFDLAFLSVDSFRPEYGFVCCNAYYASMLSALREQTDRIVSLMDSSKINLTRTAWYFPTEKVDIVVTDDYFDTATVQALHQAGVSVL